MVFGYIDGGAGDGLAIKRNSLSFKKLLLQPKTLLNVKIGEPGKINIEIIIIRNN